MYDVKMYIYIHFLYNLLTGIMFSINLASSFFFLFFFCFSIQSNISFDKLQTLPFYHLIAYS